MNESTNEKPAGKIKIFVQDKERIVCREGQKIDEDSDFIFIQNESGQREGIPKRLIVRYLEVD